jgi:hypothetical protein
MQVDRVGRHAPFGVILAEDELGRLLVVLVHFAAVRFTLFGEFFGQGTVAVRVGFLALRCMVCVSITVPVSSWCIEPRGGGEGQAHPLET